MDQDAVAGPLHDPGNARPPAVSVSGRHGDGEAFEVCRKGAGVSLEAGAPDVVGVGWGKGRNDTLRTSQRLFGHLYSPVSRRWPRARGDVCGSNSGATGPAAQTIEDEDEKDVALAQVIQTGGQVRPVGCGTGSAVFEHALASSVIKGVELAVEYLATFGGGYASIANEAHRVTSLWSRKICLEPILS